MARIYNLMCKDVPVLSVNYDTGEVVVKNEELIPVGLGRSAFCSASGPALLYLQKFDQWCADRMLPMSRKNVKKICNALGIAQDSSVMTKAKLARAYHSCTLTDSYWTKREGDDRSWSGVSLHMNHSSNILTPVSLCGKSMTVFNRLLNSVDLGINGTFAKSWVRDADNSYRLMKADDDNKTARVYQETAASDFISRFTDNVVRYVPDVYDGQVVSSCGCFTSDDHAYISFSQLVQETGHQAAFAMVLEAFPRDFAMMAVMAYLTGNEDLHSGNWGLIQDMNTGKFVSFGPLFDFNYCFEPDYERTEALPFLPESVIVDTETGNEITADQMEEYDFEIRHGRTMKEAALHYACTYLPDYPWDRVMPDAWNSIPEGCRDACIGRCQEFCRLVREKMASERDGAEKENDSGDEIDF